MKIMAPAAMSSLTRVYEFRGKCWICVSNLLMVDLASGPGVHGGREIWPFWAKHAKSPAPLDEGVPRVRAEYLIMGSAYPPESERRACAVEARIGLLRKRLVVQGDRYWNGAKQSAPQPFVSMPLTWSEAYGGEGVAENPLGKGAAPTQRDGMPVHWLPNVENPSQPIAAPTDRVSPAGFGPIDAMWPQRTRYLGTYDDAWLKAQFPAIAADTDWRYFNRAPEDQQQQQPFTGDEEYVFQNMHPTQPYLEGRLPGLRARAFVTQRVGGEEKFKEVKTQLNTLWFFPDAERAILVFQGIHEIAEDDGADIVHLMTALEHLDQPRPADHYLVVRDKRLDQENGVLEALREDDLMPAELVAPLIDFTPRENRALERGHKRAEIERAKAREEVARHGLDPDVHAPPVKGEAAPEIRDLDDLLRVRPEMAQRMKKMQQQVVAEKAKSVDEARALFKREGKDFSLIEREMAGLETRGPPKPFVDDLLTEFRGHIAAGQHNKAGIAELEQMVADDQLHVRWRDGEAKQRMAYRMMAHHQIPVDRVMGDLAQATRRRVMAQQAAGGDLHGWDLTGADLSGLDLSGANLEGALMERANLTGTNLAGANLRDAVLAHADVLSAQCQNTVFAGANLGAARIEKSDFEGADLSGAVFAKAKLSDVSWRGARLDDVRLEEAQMLSIDCTGAHAEKMLVFHQLDLRGFSFANTRLRLATFIECDVRGVDFSGAVFEKCAFVTLQAAGANFSGMRITSGCFAQQCDLAGANFTGAALANMSFRGANLAGAVLREAGIHGSDFSECDLTDADLSRADAHEARFVRAKLLRTRFEATNLMDAVLQHATLDETDYRGANLFQSDFARVRVGPGARFDGALLTRMRTLPRHRDTTPSPT